MARPIARLKLGYYPLPIEEAQNIRSLLVSAAPYATIDPCAGEGTALLEITKDSEAHLAAIELDADRAAAAPEGNCDRPWSAFECRVLAETCSLLYLNPPYDTEFGPHSNKRMELVFLEHCYRWVTSEGVLVFVVPLPPSERARVCLQASLTGYVSFVWNIQSQFGSIRSSCLANERKHICGASRRVRRSCFG